MDEDAELCGIICILNDDNWLQKRREKDVVHDNLFN